MPCRAPLLALLLLLRPALLVHGGESTTPTWEQYEENRKDIERAKREEAKQKGLSCTPHTYRPPGPDAAPAPGRKDALGPVPDAGTRAATTTTPAAQGAPPNVDAGTPRVVAPGVWSMGVWTAVVLGAVVMKLILTMSYRRCFRRCDSACDRPCVHVSQVWHADARPPVAGTAAAPTEARTAPPLVPPATAHPAPPPAPPAAAPVAAPVAAPEPHAPSAPPATGVPVHAPGLTAAHSAMLDKWPLHLYGLAPTMTAGDHGMVAGRDNNVNYVLPAHDVYSHERGYNVYAADAAKPPVRIGR